MSHLVTCITISGLKQPFVGGELTLNPFNIVFALVVIFVTHVVLLSYYRILYLFSNVSDCRDVKTLTHTSVPYIVFKYSINIFGLAQLLIAK